MALPAELVLRKLRLPVPALVIPALPAELALAKAIAPELVMAAVTVLVAAGWLAPCGRALWPLGKVPEASGVPAPAGVPGLAPAAPVDRASMTWMDMGGNSMVTEAPLMAKDLFSVSCGLASSGLLPVISQCCAVAGVKPFRDTVTV